MGIDGHRWIRWEMRLSEKAFNRTGTIQPLNPCIDIDPLSLDTSGPEQMGPTVSQHGQGI